MNTNHQPKRSLKMSTLIATIFVVWMVPHARSVAATVPAGTAIVVTMAGPLSSHESRGRTFKTELAADLKAGGKTVVPAGTTIFGVVEKSRKQLGAATTTSPLTVNLQSVVINGKQVPIKTTGGVSPETVGSHTNLQRRTGTTVGRSVLSRGTKLAFHLAEPLNL